MHTTTGHHFNYIPLKERLLHNEASFLTGIAPRNVYEMVYDNGAYYTVVGVWPNQERIWNFKQIWESLSEKYPLQLLPVYFLVEHGTKTNFMVVHFRKQPIEIV